MSVSLVTNKYYIQYSSNRYITSYGEQRTSLNISWDAMMKNVMNCGETLEVDISNNGDIYLCKKDDSWSRCYSGYGRNCYQGCQTFSLDQDDFCNGVFDFPLNETSSKYGTSRTYYYLSNCNVTE